MSFQTEGYALRPVFAHGRLTDLHAGILAHMDRVARALHLPFEESEPEAPLALRLERVAARDPSYANLLRIAACTDAHRAPAFAALAADMVLQDCIRELAGGEPEAVILRLRASIAALPGEGQHWHSDVALADGSTCSRVGVTCWVPLMDAGPESGGLELVTGRRTAPFAHVSGAGRFEIPEAQLDGLLRVRPVCPAGSVIFLDRYTPHRTLPCLGGRGRWSLVIWARMPAAAHRPQEAAAA